MFEQTRWAPVQFTLRDASDEERAAAADELERIMLGSAVMKKYFQVGSGAPSASPRKGAAAGTTSRT